MTPSIASPPSKKAERPAVLRTGAVVPMGWPDRVGGARLGRSLSQADRALAQRAAQNRAAHTALFLLLAAVVAVIGTALTRRAGAAKGAPAEKTLIA
jgi:hypothetical protein